MEIKVGLWRLEGAPGGSVALRGGDADTPHAIFNPADLAQLAEALQAFTVAVPAAAKTPTASPKPTTCRSCGARMFWAVTPAGRRMPVNAQPDPNGTMVMTLATDGLRLDMWRADEPSHAAPRNRWTSHFATCPSAGEYRRGT